MKQSLSQGDLGVAKKAHHDLCLGTGPKTRVGHKEKKREPIN